jgi:hypothetical protein
MLEGERHRLELRVPVADQRSELLESEVPVEPHLTGGAGNDGEVAAAVAEMLVRIRTSPLNT